jgi:hypothetical protein
VHEREMLAVITALKEWRHYLLGQPFELYTDNAAVSYFLKQPSLTPRQARWVQIVSEYDFQLYHLPGKQNVLADALSRVPSHYPASPSHGTTDIHKACSRSLLGATTNSCIDQAPTLSALRSGPTGSSNLHEQLLEDAQSDPEYANVLASAEEGQLPDLS